MITPIDIHVVAIPKKNTGFFYYAFVTALCMLRYVSGAYMVWLLLSVQWCSGELFVHCFRYLYVYSQERYTGMMWRHIYCFVLYGWFVNLLKTVLREWKEVTWCYDFQWIPCAKLWVLVINNFYSHHFKCWKTRSQQINVSKEPICYNNVYSSYSSSWTRSCSVICMVRITFKVWNVTM